MWRRHGERVLDWKTQPLDLKTFLSKKRMQWSTSCRKPSGSGFLLLPQQSQIKSWKLEENTLAFLPSNSDYFTTAPNKSLKLVCCRSQLPGALCGAEARRCLQMKQWNSLCLILECFCLGVTSDLSSPIDKAFRGGEAREFGPWSLGLEMATLNCGILPSKRLWQEKAFQLAPSRGLLLSIAVCLYEWWKCCLALDTKTQDSKLYWRLIISYSNKLR